MIIWSSVDLGLAIFFSYEQTQFTHWSRLKPGLTGTTEITSSRLDRGGLLFGHDKPCIGSSHTAGGGIQVWCPPVKPEAKKRQEKREGEEEEEAEVSGAVWTWTRSCQLDFLLTPNLETVWDYWTSRSSCSGGGTGSSEHRRRRICESER